MVDAVLTAAGVRVELMSGAPVIEEFRVDVRRGEIVGIVGESGSGKTTAGLALLGYTRSGMRIADGHVRVAGHDLLGGRRRDLRRLRGDVVSYVPQDPSSSLNPSVRIGRQLEFVARAHERRVTREQIVTAFERVGLPATREFVRRFPHQLSGGQQQRAVIAKALVCDPAVVVLDEPTTGLDVITQAVVLREIERLCREADVGMIYISHDLAVIAQISTRTLVMYAGRIVESGTTDTLVREPRHPYTRALVLSIPDHIEPRRLEGVPGVAVGVGGRPHGCAFAPRCPQRATDCDERMPELVAVPIGREVRCHHASLTPPLAREPVRSFGDAASSTPLLTVDGLRAEYPSRAEAVVAVGGISFTVGAGECVALVGESGSGKTTVGRCLAGLHAPAAGEIRIDGIPLPATARARSRHERRAVQIVFQNPYDSLNPRYRVGRSIARAATVLRGLSVAEAAAEVTELLEKVRLPPQVASRFPRELSGGECQRVALARALAAQPRLLVCDEVTSALDVSVQAAVINLLADLQRELGLSILFISHDLGVVASISKRIFVMADGSIREHGTAREVITSPRDAYTQRLLAAAPRLVIDSTPSAVSVGADRSSA